MDISTLPIEMVGSILKYMDHIEVFKLRSSSTLMDKVAKRYGLGTRLPVEECWFDLESGSATMTIFLRDSVGTAYNLRSTEDGTIDYEYKFTSTEWQQLKPILDKIKVNNFTLETCVLNRKTQQTLYESSEAFRHCKSIEFNNVNLACSKEEFTRFVAIFPKAVDLSTRGVDRNEYILNFECISSRKWANISVYNWIPVAYQKLDDRVLEIIVANRTALELREAFTRFSVQGVAKALQALSIECEGIGYSAWGFLDAGDMEHEDAVELFATIPGIQVKWKSDTRTVKVTFDRDPSMSVRFGFGKPI